MQRRTVEYGKQRSKLCKGDYKHSRLVCMNRQIGRGIGRKKLCIAYPVNVISISRSDPELDLVRAVGFMQESNAVNEKNPPVYSQQGQYGTRFRFISTAVLAFFFNSCIFDQKILLVQRALAIGSPIPFSAVSAPWPGALFMCLRTYNFDFGPRERGGRGHFSAAC